jgi:SAM-dependent methyltransferase
VEIKHPIGFVKKMQKSDRPRHTVSDASPWVERFAPLVRAGGPVLDVAAGSGRNTRLFLARGHEVVAVDWNVEGLADLAGEERLTILEADLELGGPWPFLDRRFAGVVVTNYLHRPLLPLFPGALEPGGVLIYETFAMGNAAFGKPSNPDFLLRRGELLDAFADKLEVVAYEDLKVDVPKPAMVQRICAVRRGGVAD